MGGARGASCCCADKRRTRRHVGAAQQQPRFHVAGKSHAGLAALFSNCVYVGVVDDDYILLQHLTKLYIVHVGIVSEEFAYQQVRKIAEIVAEIAEIAAKIRRDRG